ncbi:hypothetical protein DFJ74DRAFT_747647 [Hyaloraphidium curvatum]|nr:hypothetical protein DFJ74DRAFT_747647 [Hyaloraphidium curvatum]
MVRFVILLALALLAAAAAPVSAQSYLQGCGFGFSCCGEPLSRLQNQTLISCDTACKSDDYCYLYNFKMDTGDCIFFPAKCGGSGRANLTGWMFNGYPGQCPDRDGLCNQPLRYAACGFGRQCCDVPLAYSLASSRQECELSCDMDLNCRVIAYSSSTSLCYRYGHTCTNYRAVPGWALSAKPGAGLCPARSGCKVNLRINVPNRTVKRGQHVTLTATASNADTGRAVASIQIVFLIGPIVVGRANTNRQGVASLRYRYPASQSLGRRQITARFAGSSSFNAGSANATLQVNR